MTNKVIDAATMSNSTFVVLGGGQQTLLLLLAIHNARDIRTRAQEEEEEAIEAEDILTQTEEANAVDPVG